MKKFFRKRKLIKNRLISTQKRKTTEPSALTTFFEKSRFFRFFLICFTFLFTLLILTINWDKTGLYLINYFTGDTFYSSDIIHYIFFVFGFSIICAIIVLNISQILRIFQTQCFKSNLDLLQGVFLYTISLAITKCCFLLLYYHTNNTVFGITAQQLLYYLPLLPSAMSAILYGILMNTAAGFIFIILLSISLAVLYGGKFVIFLLCIISLSIGMITSVRARRRTHLIRAGLLIGLIQSLCIVAIGLIFNKPFNLLPLQSLMGVVNGFLAAFFAAGLLPIVEYMFKVTTDIRLLELSDLNHPLLKKLIIEAPGTYHHSLIVANIAEAAAEVVGANPLLTRVGAYFHDIGKLKKPEYFSENEWRGKSRHDDLIPSMSSLIIISHVKDGVDLARKYRLNKEIVDIIEQHHGTGVVYFFYKRAEIAKQENQKINEDEYRYPGPCPQSKEAAIILIADAVEAASRSLDRPTPARIKKLIQDIINARIAASQLDDCQLTLKDLAKIKECFSFILTGIFHTRPKYPKEEETIKQELISNGNSNKRPAEKVQDTQ